MGANAELVRAATRALETPDAAAFFADDVEWWAAGDPAVLPWAGTTRGIEAVRRQRKLVASLLDYVRVEIPEWIEGDGAVAALYDCTVVARATGRRFESMFVRIWTMTEGKIVRIRTFYDTAAYAAALRA